MSSHHITATHDALRDVLADYSVGGLINAVDAVAKQQGDDSIPEALRYAVAALHEALEALGLDSGQSPRAAEVWADR